ncbi:GNAT family N-acetyltransferase [Paenibacillus sp. J5C_2022]|uniref:GNAT family N-acetyltransferase n=1 Tax=Paenibacillus sp. J5C2022 TaxID=2977129 RepID=UPI0021D0F1C4|nr:GNAT family N-acetyltransferase [Paenibacillus sp. J5C2022]MCU6713146.1 GNAT family N-acetyltransferase [Paenibacillus sp. J5C2022]
MKLLFNFEELIKMILNHSNEIVVIAVMNEVPVGFVCAQYYQSICYSDPSAEITELYVTSHARRKGIASKLLNYIENELLINGVKSVKVLTGKKNGITIKTYVNSNYIMKDEQVLQKKF